MSLAGTEKRCAVMIGCCNFRFLTLERVFPLSLREPFFLFMIILRSGKGGDELAKTNYSFQKRQKELLKKAKKEEKKQRKQLKNLDEIEDKNEMEEENDSSPDEVNTF